MLSDLIAPGCTTFAAEAFKEPFLEFENRVQRYGVPSGGTLGSSLMVAVIVMSRHSPPKLRSAPRSHIKTTGTDYQKLRTIVNDFLTNVLVYTSAGVVSETRMTSANDIPVPMDVGGKQETRERAIERTKEGPRLEPKVSNGFPRSRIHVRNLETQACQLSAETRQCIQFSRDTIITASSVSYQEFCSIFCRCVDRDDIWTTAVQSSTSNAENCEFMLDTAAKDISVIQVLCEAMCRLSGNVTNKVGTSR